MPYFKNYSKFGNANAGKKEDIEKAVKRKEDSIKKYTDSKSLSIAVSSAFNGASQIATALLHNGELKMEQYWEAHKQLYEEYLTFFLEAQSTEASKFAQKAYESTKVGGLLIPDVSKEKAL